MREDGGMAAAIPKILPPRADPLSPALRGEYIGGSRAFNVSTESEPMTGRNRDAETTLPFSHLARACPDITRSPPVSSRPRYRSDSSSSLGVRPVSRPSSLFPHQLRLYRYFRPWVTSGIDNGYH